MKIISRLKKNAEIEELGDKNIPQNLIDQILQMNGEGVTAQSVVFRRLMNSNTRFIVEIWALDDGTFGVFYGYFEGQWNIDIINYYGELSSLPEAELFVQTNLQSQAESKENIISRKNSVRKMMAAGKEPDYNKLTKDFLKNINFTNSTDINKYYRDWVQYMNKYYPEWAAYPAFIWRGWGYVTNLVDNKEDNKEDNKDNNDTNQINSLPLDAVPSNDIGDFSSFDGGGDV